MESRCPALPPVPPVRDCTCPLHRKLLLASLKPPTHHQASLTLQMPSRLIHQHSTSKKSPIRRYRLCRRSEAEEIVMSAPISHGIPRRYVSGVRLEVKPVPWLFSSSVHLKVGSTKRKYTEKVWYKMRLVPDGYFEGATADFCHVANPGARRYMASMTLECTNVPHLRLKQNEFDEDADDATDA